MHIKIPITVLIALLAWLAINLWNTRELEIERIRDRVTQLEANQTGIMMDVAVLKIKGGYR